MIEQFYCLLAWNNKWILYKIIKVYALPARRTDKRRYSMVTEIIIS